MQQIADAPSRLTLTDLNSGVTIEAQFNPTQLVERLGANWEAMEVPGLSHKPLHFMNTSNEQQVMTLWFRAISRAELDRIHAARRFLKSLTFPTSGADDLQSGSPPRVLVVWPQMVSMIMVLRTLTMTHLVFNREARSVQFTADLEWEEIRDWRITSEDVWEDNQFRFGDLPGFFEGGS